MTTDTRTARELTPEEQTAITLIELRRDININATYIKCNADLIELFEKALKSFIVGTLTLFVLLFVLLALLAGYVIGGGAA